MLIDRLGNIDEDEDGGSSVKRSLHFIIFGRLRENLNDPDRFRFNMKRILVDPGAAKPPPGSEEVVSTCQFKTKDHKDDKKKRAQELRRIDNTEKKKNKNAPFLSEHRIKYLNTNQIFHNGQENFATNA